LILTFISANVKRDLGWRQGVVDEEESYEGQLGKNARDEKFKDPNARTRDRDREKCLTESFCELWMSQTKTRSAPIFPETLARV
jgi:hypothetical protein